MRSLATLRSARFGLGLPTANRASQPSAAAAIMIISDFKAVRAKVQPIKLYSIIARW